MESYILSHVNERYGVTYIIMYKSRFRCRMRKSNTYAEQESCTTIYSNRTNHHVIKRMLDTSRIRYMSMHHTSNQANILKLAELQQNSECVMVNSIGYHVRTRMVEDRRNELHRSIQAYALGEHETTWDTKTTQLYQRHTDNLEKLVISNNIVGRPVEKFYTDPEKCPLCMVFFVFDHITNINSCTGCGYTTNVLFVTEDNSKDEIVTKDPNACIGPLVVRAVSDYRYIRSPLYRKYLLQFSEDIKPIPIDVMRVLYKYLSNIHLQNSIRCRPTPVSNILRSHGFIQWSSHAIRISKMFNGDPIPMLSPIMINKLVDRFDIIFNESNKLKMKLPSFEFLTNILLRFECRIDLAHSFSLHKSRVVSRRILSDLMNIVNNIGVDTTYNWSNVPVF